jgi:LytR cell envelope-related transcriptional attenuator
MGRHEPPTDRSFYLSVAASTIRVVLVAALVVAGVVLINQAFPDTAASGGGATPNGGGGGLTPTGATGPSPSPGATGGTTGQPVDTPSPTITGTKIAVFNGTGVTGLAGDVTTALEQQGYVAAQEPADAPSDVADTTLYYRTNQDKVEAEYLANTFFKKISDTVRVAKLQSGTDVNRDVQVAIFLGNDYAQVA